MTAPADWDSPMIGLHLRYMSGEAVNGYRVFLGAVVLMLGAAGLTGCAQSSSTCGPAPLSTSTKTIAAGGTVTVSSKAAECDLGLNDDSTYKLTLISDNDAGERTSGGTAPVEKDGSFSATVTIPADFPSGGASILVSGSALQKCDDGESCAAYTTRITIKEG